MVVKALGGSVKCWLMFGLLIVIVVATGLFWQLNQAMSEKVAVNQPTLITIAPGSSFNRFSQQLVEQEIIDNRFWLRNYARFYPKYSNIKAGTYQVMPEQTVKDLLELVLSGKEFHYQVTFVEGSTLKQWLEQIKLNQSIVKTLNYQQSETLYQQVAQALQLELIHPEGLFFPDTYAFTQGTTDVQLLKRAYQKMDALLERCWQERQTGLPLNNRYEALILASIIEKESGQQAEFQIISSVFINRLNANMRLQTDPTVIYGLGERYQGDIKRIHLKEKTPYNTYRIKGLPPTPIAMPGELAIAAAMQPAATNYFYFVSNGQGKHIFSETLTEHNNAVKQYQLN